MKNINNFEKFLESIKYNEYEISVNGYNFVVIGQYEKGESGNDGCPEVKDNFEINKIFTFIDDDKIEVDKNYLNNIGLSYSDIEESVLDKIND